MRLSRWGQSPYETDADLSRERAALEGLVRVCDNGSDAEVIVVHSKVPMGEEQHKRAPSLRLLVTTTSGTDHIDRDYFADAGIGVARLPEARRDAVVDTTIGSLIWGLRRLGALQRFAASNQWGRARLPEIGPVGIRGAKIGVVGLGVIGGRVANVLTAMGAQVWGADPRGLPPDVQHKTVPQMVSECDAVTLHCDLNETTRRMFDRDLLRSARSDLVIVNTARGDILDAEAAIEMATQEQLGGLALDVFPTEPWHAMSVRSPRVLLMPHAAGYHVGLADLVCAGLVAAVGAFATGQPVPHLVGRSKSSP